MSERETALKSVVVTFFPMFIATLSLVTSIYNGYLNSKFVDIIQSNVGRVEYMRTCKEIIDGYFQVKFRAGAIGAAATGPGAGVAQVDGGQAVARFAALGTYLANLRDERVRERYTELTRRLEAVIAKAGAMSTAELKSAFEPADTLFAEMNDDCVRSAKAAPM